MATSIAARYQHLEPRPGSNYRQLFLKAVRKNNFSNSFGNDQECLFFQGSVCYRPGTIAEVIFAHCLRGAASAPRSFMRPSTVPTLIRPRSSLAITACPWKRSARRSTTSRTTCR